MMILKIYQAVGLKRMIGVLASTAILLSAGCTDEEIPEDDWHLRPKGEAIEFKDSNVLEILLQHGVDANGDGAISYEEAAAVKSVERWFAESAIQSFDEFEYFSGVTLIDELAFQVCSLTSITIPDSVTEIEGAAFINCSNLEKFEGKFASADNRYLEVDGVLVAFAPAGLKKYTIPDSVTKIGEYAFEGCSSLKSITIPDSVKEIEKSAFKGCSSLTTITIPDGVTVISEFVFEGCSSLKTITIPDNVTTIGYHAFCYCNSLTSITIPDSVTEIEGYAFGDCSSLVSIKIPDSVTTIGYCAFYNCSSLTSITIPDSVKEIDICVFGSCSSLEKFEGKFASADKRCLIIDGVLKAFAPAGLSEYTIPDNVTEIGESAFINCSNLTDITIHNRVTKIGYAALYGCNSLTSITFPDSVTEIGENMFNCCDNLTSVFCKPTTPPACGEGEFYIISSATIYVPRASVEAYKTAAGWSKHADMIVGYDF